LTAPPYTVAPRPGAPHGTTELALAASAVVRTPTGPALHLTLEQLYGLIEELHQVAQYHESTAAPEPALTERKLDPGPAVSNHARVREHAEALPSDFPRGPWYAVLYGSHRTLPGACACCKEDIVRQSRFYYLLVDSTGQWTDAALHRRCALAVQKYRFYEFDLVHP
jgi:hypothetical protein